MLRKVGGALLALALAGLLATGAIAGRFMLLADPLPLDPAATAWVNAVRAAGGTVSVVQQNRVNALVRCLKVNALWSTNSVLDRLWLYASENAQQASIDVVALGTHTVHGTPTFTAGQGYTGDGTAAYLDTGVNMATAGGNYALNSAAMGAYVITGTATSAIKRTMGAFNGSSFAEMITDGAGNCSANLNTGATGAAAATATSLGSWLITRTASNAETLYKNGSSAGTDATTSSAIPSFSVFVFALSNSGSPAGFSPEQIAAAYWGAAMNSTQVANFEACLNGGYMASLGIALH